MHCSTFGTKVMSYLSECVGDNDEDKVGRQEEEISATDDENDK